MDREDAWVLDRTRTQNKWIRILTYSLELQVAAR